MPTQQRGVGREESADSAEVGGGGTKVLTQHREVEVSTII